MVLKLKLILEDLQDFNNPVHKETFPLFLCLYYNQQSFTF